MPSHTSLDGHKWNVLAKMLSVLIACAGVADLDRFKISLSASTVLDFQVEVVGVGSMSMYEYFDIFFFSSSSLLLLSFSHLTILIPAQPRRETGSPAAQGFFFLFLFFRNQKRSEVKRRQAQDRSTQVPGRNPDTGVTIYRRTTIPWRRAALRARQYSSSLSYSDSEQLSSEDSVR